MNRLLKCTFALLKQYVRKRNEDRANGHRAYSRRQGTGEQV